MTIRQIRTDPDPILRRKAKRVPSIDKQVLELIDDMVETMRVASGVGLAAPQVGISLKVVVIQIPGDEVIALINPEIIKREGERTITEACLSIPGYHGEVKRSVLVKVKAVDRQGKIIRIKGEELMAQALEHEIDHLNGVLYTDLVESPNLLQKVAPEEADEGL